MIEVWAEDGVSPEQVFLFLLLFLSSWLFKKKIQTKVLKK